MFFDYDSLTTVLQFTHYFYANVLSCPEGSVGGRCSGAIVCVVFGGDVLLVVLWPRASQGGVLVGRGIALCPHYIGM